MLQNLRQHTHKRSNKRRAIRELPLLSCFFSLTYGMPDEISNLPNQRSPRQRKGTGITSAVTSPTFTCKPAPPAFVLT